MSVGHVLKEGLRVDRLPGFPVKDREDTFDPGVEVERAGIAAFEAVDGAFDDEWLQGHACRPVAPALHRPYRRVGQTRFRARVVAEDPSEMPLNPGVDGRADGGHALFLTIGGLHTAHGCGD